ncbi:MAG: hypothetical protein ACR2HB_00410 [Dehalococcoidia bacterium]
MASISYARHQFPPAVVQHAIWLYLRFSLSYRDIEDLLAERGIEIIYETIRRWVLKLGPLFARELLRSKPRPTLRWHGALVKISVRRIKIATASAYRIATRSGELMPCLPKRPAERAGAGAAKGA